MNFSAMEFQSMCASTLIRDWRCGKKKATTAVTLGGLMYLQGQLLRNKKELDKRATMPGGEELETIHLLHHHHQGPLKGMERKRGERLWVLVHFFVCFVVIKGT